MFFEVPDASDQKKKPSRAVSAEQLADLVNDASIPVVILNACQSGKQETEPETNLASRLAQAGVQAVLAMAYSVTVSAARNFMEAFYREAFNGKPLSEAITRARQTLLLNKARNAYFGLTVDLEDWMLPVLYENEAVQFQIRATEEERRARLKRSNELFHAHPTKHRFWGRDLDILNIERRILSAADRNILLIEGMGGTGKSTLLQHLGWWWQTTGLISRVFNFEYDQKPWTRQQILHEISRALDLRTDPNERFHQEEVVSELQSHPYLLVLDNLESVTGEQLAIGQSLSQAERQNLHEFLQKLRGAKTLVLVGSRSKEEWLGPGTFGDNIHPLRGLDPEARSGFADEVLRAVGADPNQLRSIPEYRELLSLLGGHPLAMQVILSNLGNKTPAEVLSALREGDVKLDHGETRTESILKCIDYSHNNLSPEARSLLECFAPFTSVVLRAGLDQYVRLLREQPELAALPWERLPNVLKEAERWGLVREEGPFLHLQPVLPFFLRSRADSPDGAARKRAVEEAFRKHYNGLCQAIYSMQRSKEPAKRQTGQLLAQKERENVLQALHLSLAGRESILNPYKVLDELFGQAQDHAAGLLLAQKVTFSIENYPPELLAGPLGLEMVGVLDDAASHLLHLKKFADAETGYRRALALLGEKKIQAGLSAGIYHQLGNVALEQRQWGEAERNYREALRIKVEFNDRYSRASTYHQLGRVAEEQRQWAEAEKNYREALRIYVEFNDRYEQAGTYHQLGSVAQAQRQWGEAEKNYREALRIKVESNDRYSQASTYHQLGMVAEEQRQWAEAEKNYREALRIYVEFNDRYAQASTYHQLGRVAQERRQWGEAEKHYREALRIYVEFNDRYAQAGTYHQLGRVAQERRQWGEAEKHYREALRIYVEFHDRYMQGSTYHNLGRVAQEQRQWDEAGKNYREALRIFAEFNDQHSLAVTLRNIVSMAPERPGIPDWVAEILGVTADEVQKLFEAIRPDPGEPPPESAAAAPE